MKYFLLTLGFFLTIQNPQAGDDLEKAKKLYEQSLDKPKRSLNFLKQSADLGYIPAILNIRQKELDEAVKYEEKTLALYKKIYDEQCAEEENKADGPLTKIINAANDFNDACMESGAEVCYIQEEIERLKELINQGVFMEPTKDPMADILEIRNFSERSYKPKELTMFLQEEVLRECKAQERIISEDIQILKQIEKTVTHTDLKNFLSNMVRGMEENYRAPLNGLIQGINQKKISYKKYKNFLDEMLICHEDGSPLEEAFEIFDPSRFILNHLKKAIDITDPLDPEKFQQFSKIRNNLLEVLEKNHGGKICDPDYARGLYFDMASALVKKHDETYSHVLPLEQVVQIRFLFLHEAEEHTAQAMKLMGMSTSSLPYFYHEYGKERSQFYRSLFLKRSYKPYQDVIFKNYQVVEGFLDFGHKAVERLQRLSFVKIHEALDKSGAFDLCDQTKQQIWVHRKQPYFIRVKKDQNVFTIGFLAKRPSNRGEASNIENELAKYVRWPSGFAHLIPGTHSDDSESGWSVFNLKSQGQAHFHYAK